VAAARPREGQEGPRLPGPAVADDERPVMHGVLEARDEDRVEQLFRDVRVEEGPRLDELVEGRLALEDDEGADALLREGARRLDHLLDDRRLLCRALALEEG